MKYLLSSAIVIFTLGKGRFEQKTGYNVKAAFGSGNGTIPWFGRCVSFLL